MNKGYRIRFNIEVYDRDDYGEVIDYTYRENVPLDEDPINYLKNRFIQEVENLSVRANVLLKERKEEKAE